MSGDPRLAYVYADPGHWPWVPGSPFMGGQVTGFGGSVTGSGCLGLWIWDTGRYLWEPMAVAAPTEQPGTQVTIYGTERRSPFVGSGASTSSRHSRSHAAWVERVTCAELFMTRLVRSPFMGLVKGHRSWDRSPQNDTHEVRSTLAVRVAKAAAG